MRESWQERAREQESERAIKPEEPDSQKARIVREPEEPEREPERHSKREIEREQAS